MMNSVNRTMGAIFDVLMAPLEQLGPEFALIVASGLTGIVGIVIFKFISWQKGIKGVKDKIKGNLIVIRIYQDDLAIVFKAVFKIIGRNFQYLGLNFGPILPLLPPMVLVLGQLVVRYSYDPMPVVTMAEADALLPGEGTMLTVALKREHASDVGGLQIDLPEGIHALTPVVRSSNEGWARVEIVAVGPVMGEVVASLDGQVLGTKEIVAGDERARSMHPKRGSGLANVWMYPAEDVFGPDDPLDSIELAYPDRELRYLMDGELGILLMFFLFSILFGAAILKPLKIQI